MLPFNWKWPLTNSLFPHCWVMFAKLPLGLPYTLHLTNIAQWFNNNWIHRNSQMYIIFVEGEMVCGQHSDSQTRAQCCIQEAADDCLILKNGSKNAWAKTHIQFISNSGMKNSWWNLLNYFKISLATFISKMSVREFMEFISTTGCTAVTHWIF